MSVEYGFLDDSCHRFCHFSTHLLLLMPQTLLGGASTPRSVFDGVRSISAAHRRRTRRRRGKGGIHERRSGLSSTHSRGLSIRYSPQQTTPHADQQDAGETHVWVLLSGYDSTSVNVLRMTTEVSSVWDSRHFLESIDLHLLSPHRFALLLRWSCWAVRGISSPFSPFRCRHRGPPPQLAR